MSAKPFIVVGAGGHAKVVLEALRGSGAEIAGILERDASLWNGRIEGALVLGGDELISKHPAGSVSLANGLGGGFDTAARRALFERFAALGHRFPPVVAPSAVVAASAVLGDGCQVLTRAVVHPGSRVGTNAVVNTAALVEHDCEVGDHAFLGPAAVLCGGVSVGEGAFLGAGALILPGVRVGARAKIGAGAVVRQDLPDDARVLR